MTRWSRKHERCRGCETTERPHHGRGYCQACYARRWDRSAAGKAAKAAYRARLARDPAWRRQESARVLAWYYRRRKAGGEPGPTTGAAGP